MARLGLEAVSKTFGKTAVVDDVSLEVESGTFAALLGPSGCGKTTLLRLIAGLETPDAGRIALGERAVADGAVFVEPEDRGLGMVFQSYALWPHMTVAENVAFGLRVRRIPAAERRRLVAEALAAVDLSAYGERKPGALSGGQRQRVALARCLALRPPVVLLDEPLANLDPHLRGTMQRAFRRIHRETGTTFLYVTHDQSEAMALADRIAVMDRGRVQQVASPMELYRRPANAMVAGFIGHGSVVPVDVLDSEGGERLLVALAGRRIRANGVAGKGAGLLCLRRENLTIVPPPADGAERDILPARVADVRYQGDGFAAEVVLDGMDATVLQAHARTAPMPGDAIGLRVDDAWVLKDERMGR
ncbi:ABC transporter ATP-binding protein [Marinivivus vitaminiproducens]|uniref:ABC transporter ATP-binding protein n=1 Tax=Marinivivus vitaminiproducens TaxID=3035935 RepID=UPI002797E181|nr:ABC transporter ATP-binding protein [Geminicoccaceae bacterium SCSIO 64248]